MDDNSNNPEEEAIELRIKRLKAEIAETEAMRPTLTSCSLTSCQKQKPSALLTKEEQKRRESLWVQMLKREVELRKSPEMQKAMEKAEESVDSEWMDVAVDIQNQVVQEFRSNNDNDADSSCITLHELRLAALRHPEIAFWVKYNRAREADLPIGGVAPDVPLMVAKTGRPTMLWSRCNDTKSAVSPTTPIVVVAGSLS